MNRIAVPKDFEANRRWRMKALHDGAKVGGAARALREACKNDVLFWINTFCWTYDPRTAAKRVPFTTYGYQDRAILSIEAAIREGRDVGIKKSRDMGASWVNLIVPLHEWMFWDANSFLLVSRNEDYVDAPGDSKSLFWKLDFLLDHQPNWLKPRKIKRTSMHLENADNGSVIDGESTTGEVARGDRRTAILLDEFAAFETKCSFNALAATQSATNCRIFNSTPKGQSNAFYEVIHHSAAEIVTMHWSEHPVKNRGLYTSVRDEKTGKMELKLLDTDYRGVVEVRRKGEPGGKKVAFPEDYPFILDGKTRSPWYDLQCARAVTNQEIAQELDIDFMGSDFQFFDALAVERYRDNFCREPAAVGDLELGTGDAGVVRFVPNRKGHFRFWEMPNERTMRYSEDRRFVLGVDVSAGTGSSNSTIVVYDKRTREKVAEYANPNILPDEFGRFVVAVARFFNNARVIPDRSGPTGEVLTRRMVAEGYTNIYRMRDDKKVGSPVKNEYGVWLNPANRTTILQQYRDAIGRCAVVNRSHDAMGECLRFIMTSDGNIQHSAAANSIDPNGARNNHGDLVIADALATMLLLDERDVEAARPAEIPVDSVGWRMEMARRIAAIRDADSLSQGWEV